MPASAARHSRELLLRSLVYIPVFLLLAVQYLEARKSSERAVGITFELAGHAVEIDATTPGGPADQGGLRAGDVVRAIEGRPIESIIDYDLAAEGFARGRPVEYQVERSGTLLTLAIVPGAAIDWPPLLFNVLLVVAFFSMGLLSLARRPGSMPANLLYWLFVLAALEMAQPSSTIGAPLLSVVTGVTTLLLNGAQFGTMLHLACVIPQRQGWVRRRPWVVPALYGTGFLLGTVGVVTYLIDEVWARGLLPWSYAFFRNPVQSVWMLVWAILMIVFLSFPALFHKTRQGRRQAALVLLGSLPWAVYTATVMGFDLMGRQGPAWLYADWWWAMTLAALPLSIFIMLQMQSAIQNTLLIRLTSRLQGAGSVEKISQLISRDLNLAFNTKCNYIFFREDADSDLTSVHSSGARIGVDDIPESYEILGIVDRDGEVITYPDDLEDELPAREQAWLESLRADLIVPVTSTDHRLIGLLILGKKASEEPYIAHDFDILRSLAGQIAMAYENIGLHVQVHEQDRVQRQVLDRFEEAEIYLVKECPTCGTCYDSTVELCTEDGSPLALTLPVERTIEGRYRLDKVLGKGGVAIVYVAMDLRLNRKVAVKVLARSVMDSPDASRRFEREARMLAKLAHPRIVTIHDFGKTRRGCAFLVMEYLKGVTLGRRLRQQGPYRPEVAALLFEQILDGLGAAHRMGVIHRDLKPDNVLIAEGEDGGERSVKLLDFGLAKFHPTSGIENTNLTLPGFVIGTLAYMAPEQLNGDEADERSDLFAVGVMVFEALSGRKPFSGRTPAQVLTSIQETEVKLPGDSRAAGKLTGVVGRCLAADPADRYPSVAELRQALIPAIKACPTPTGLGRDKVPTKGGKRNTVPKRGKRNKGPKRGNVSKPDKRSNVPKGGKRHP